MAVLLATTLGLGLLCSTETQAQPPIQITNLSPNYPTTASTPTQSLPATVNFTGNIQYNNWGGPTISAILVTVIPLNGSGSIGFYVYPGGWAGGYAWSASVSFPASATPGWYIVDFVALSGSPNNYTQQCGTSTYLYFAPNYQY